MMDTEITRYVAKGRKYPNETVLSAGDAIHSFLLGQTMRLCRNFLFSIIVAFVCCLLNARGATIRSASAGGYSWRYSVTNDAARLEGSISVYSYISLSGEGTSSRTEYHPSISPNPTGEITIPSKLNGYDVKYVGEWAFGGCTSLTRVVLPSTVQEVASSAFEGCSEFEAFSIESTNLSYRVYDGILYDAEAKTLVRCPPRAMFVNVRPGVQTIGECAFSGNVSLKALCLPPTVQKIEAGAFMKCSALEMVKLPPVLSDIGIGAFAECDSLRRVSLLNSSLNIAMMAFGSCDSLETLSIPYGVKQIAENAFLMCPKLRHIYVSSDAKSHLHSLLVGSGYDDSTCEYSSQLEAPELTGVHDSIEGVTIEWVGVPWANSYRIYRTADDMSKSCLLAEINSKDALTYFDSSCIIGREYWYWIEAVGDCDFAEASVNAVSGVRHWEGYPDIPDECPVAYSLATNEDGRVAILNPVSMLPKKLVIPRELFGRKVASISDHAFKDCHSLLSVSIPQEIEDIGQEAFSGCENLTAVTMPVRQLRICQIFPDSYAAITNIVLLDGASTIDVAMFNGCCSLQNIVIPASVTQIDVSAFSGCCALKSLIIPSSALPIREFFSSSLSSITNVHVHRGAGCIPQFAFYSCGALECVELPEGVTNIGSSAFSGCVRLKEVILPKVLTVLNESMFEQCSELVKVDIPDGVTSIGRRAFSGCSGLVRVKIPESVNSILERAFEQCSSLREVKLPSHLAYLGDSAFEDCCLLSSVEIPSAVTSLGRYVFRGCNGLTNVEVYCFNENFQWSFCESWFPNVTRLVIPGSKSLYGYGWNYLGRYFPNVKELEFISGTVFIPNELCREMESLESVVFPDGLMVIGENAFTDCSSLTNVISKGVVEEIGREAFAGCAELNSLSFKEGLRTIGDYAFAECKNLVGFNIPCSVTSLGRNIFKGCKKMNMDLVIPGSMRFVESNVYSGMEGIRSLTIGEGVYEIGWEAFCGCSGITNVVLPSSLRYIGPRAFYECSSVTEITIPSNVYHMSSGVFENCTSLRSVTILSDSVWIDSWMFRGCPNLTNLSVIANSRYGRFQWYWYDRNQNLTLNILPGAAQLADYYLEGTDCMRVLNLPEGMESIGTCAVADCHNLECVSFPSTMQIIGECAFYGCNSLSKIVLPDAVTAIGPYAFDECSLSSVSVPASVDAIGLRAFGDLDVNNITIDPANSNYVIENGVLYRVHNDVKIELVQATTSLTGDFIIPETVTNVYDYAFHDCSKLASVRLPIGVKKVNGWLFSGCNNLRKVYVPRSVETVDSTAFRDLDYSVIQFENPDFYVDGKFIFHKVADCAFELAGVESSFEGHLNLADNVVSIAPSACRNCKKMRGVCFTQFVTNIGSHAFANCTNIFMVSIPSSIKSVGNNAFAYCENLNKVNVCSRELGSSAFYHCARLKTAIIDCGEIGSYAFEDCSGLESVSLGANVRSVGQYAFSYCTNLSSTVVIPQNVTCIWNNAFCSCKRIPRVTVATEHIGSYAFEGCDALSQIDFLDGVKRIGQYSFAHCTNVCTIALPKTTLEISSGAFSGCSKMTNITFAGNAPNVGARSFDGVYDECVVCVRNGTIGWDDDGDGLWNGLQILYYGVADPIPELDVTSSSAYVAAALSGSRDVELVANITNAATYNAYREWAGLVRAPNSVVRAGMQAVKEASNAWLSFALDSTSLIDAVPKEDDVQIKEFKSRGEPGQFDFTLSLEGVHVGSNAQKECLKKMFGLEGGKSLQSMASENVDITFRTPADGNVRFTAGSKDSDAPIFFMKVKLTP